MNNQPDGYPFAYLKEMAINVALDYFKNQGARKRGSGIAPENVDDVQPAASAKSAGGEADMEWQILKREIDEALTKKFGYSDKEIMIFAYIHYQGWTAKQVSELPGIGLSEKGVESLIHRMRKDLRDFLGDDEGP
jgi:DNA-directed RNA polymerase specialized sigma24 family protein